MEINALNESSAQFCMICLDMHSKLYPSNQHNLDMKYESFTGISLADAFFFTPMFCSECAQRLINCCKFRDKTLRAYQLLSELVQTNAVLSLQTLSSVDRARCQLTSSVVKKTFEPDHCDLYVTEDTGGVDKVNVKKEKNDLHEMLYLKYETEFDLEIESSEICGDAADSTANPNEDVKDNINVVYDSSSYNHEDNMQGVERNNTNVKSYENQPKTLNHKITTDITNPEAEWLTDMDDDIDIDMDEDILEVANDVDTRDGNVKMPMYGNINDNNKISDISDNIHDGIQTIGLNNEYDNYMRFAKENIHNPDHVNSNIAITNETKNNDINNIVSLNNALLIRETDKQSVLNEPHAATTDDFLAARPITKTVKKRAAKRKQPPSDERKPQRKRNRKKIIRPEKIEEPKYKEIKWFDRIERSPEEQAADLAQRQESDRYREARYKCTECYKHFNVEKTYNLHMQKHTDKYGAIECNICHVRFKRRLLLTKHLRASHKFLLRCTECAFVTTCVETANYHSRWHDGKTYECPHCEKVFTKPTSYYSHLRIAHPSDTVCALCGFSFIGERGLWMHQRMAHRDDKQELSGPQCSQCNVRFASEAAYDTHLQVSPKHGAPGDLQRNDPYFGVLEKSMLSRRERSLRRRQSIVNCKLCSAVLESRHKYNWHLRRDHPDSVNTELAYMCEQCGKFYASNVYLQEHMLRHGSQKVECDSCDKKFYSAIALRSHVLRVHNASQRGTYMCAHCAYQTKERGNFERHMKVHLDSNARRWFHCTLCVKKTTTKKALQDHILHVHQKVPWPARVRASRARAAAPRTRDTDSSES